MTKETQSYIDMLRSFGSNFGLPQVDVEKLLETNRKNLEALGESAKVAAGGAQSVAQKQREVLEAGLREASALARGYQPMGNAQEILAKQTEFVKKVFDIAVQGARDSAELSRQSTSEAVKIIQERMKASLEEIRGSVSRQGAQARSETPKSLTYRAARMRKVPTPEEWRRQFDGGRKDDGRERLQDHRTGGNEHRILGKGGGRGGGARRQVSQGSPHCGSRRSSTCRSTAARSKPTAPK